MKYEENRFILNISVNYVYIVNMCMQNIYYLISLKIINVFFIYHLLLLWHLKRSIIFVNTKLMSLKNLLTQFSHYK